MPPSKFISSASWISVGLCLGLASANFLTWTTKRSEVETPLRGNNGRIIPNRSTHDSTHLAEIASVERFPKIAQGQDQQKYASVDPKRLADLLEDMPFLIGETLNPRISALLGLTAQQSSIVADIAKRYLRDIQSARKARNMFSSQDGTESIYRVEVSPADAAAAALACEQSIANAINNSNAVFLSAMLKSQTRRSSLDEGSADLTAYVSILPKLNVQGTAFDAVTYKIRSELYNTSTGYVTTSLEEITKAQYDERYAGLYGSWPRK